MRADRKSRLILALAALLLLPALVTPLWSIGLVAPQYPDGLGMHIYVHDVRGHDRHDIQNINILNHYIGMQPIEPENIPELRIMPWVLLGLVITGLGAAALGRPRVMAAWLVAFVAAGIAGLVDFYLWNIDYGHNLSPDAPIRIPDMTYSPPIIGTAQLLNIKASSWPGLGTLFLTVGALLAGYAVVRAVQGRGAGSGARVGATLSNPSSEDANGPGRIGRARTAAAPVALLVLAAAVSGCDAGVPFPGKAPGASASVADALARAAVKPPASDADRMVYGGAHDPYCLAPVEEIRWGGVIETRSGEALRFASVACLAGYLLSGQVAPEDVARIRVVDFAQGEKLVDAGEARFLLTPNRRAPAGPAGPALMAIETERMAVNLQDAYSGKLLDWDGALRAAAEAWGLPAPR